MGNQLVPGDSARCQELQSDDLDAEIAHDIEGAESAFLVAEQQIDEMIQVMSEEIDNLRSLLERIKENRSGKHRLG